jgi:hypothetical protein
MSSQAHTGNVPSKYADIDNHIVIPNPGEKLIDLQSPLRNPNHPLNMKNMSFEINGEEIPLTLENVMLNEDNVNTLPDLIYLRKSAVAVEVIEKAASEFVFMPWIRTVETDKLVETYLRFLKSHSDDPLREDPIPIGPSGRFPRIKRGLPVERQVTLSKHGFELLFPHDALINVASSFDYVNHELEGGAYYYSHYLNRRAGVTLTNNYSTSQSGDEAIRLQAAGAVWSGVGADPIKDILDMRRVLEGQSGDGYYVKPTDLFLTPDNFRELIDFLRTVSQQWAQAPFGEYGEFMLYGIRIHNTSQDSGIPADKGIMLSDPNGAAKPLTMYHRTDPNFSRVGTLHTHEYMENNNHDHIIQLWDYIGMVNNVPPKTGMIYNM